MLVLLSNPQWSNGWWYLMVSYTDILSKQLSVMVDRIWLFPKKPIVLVDKISTLLLGCAVQIVSRAVEEPHREWGALPQKLGFERLWFQREGIFIRVASSNLHSENLKGRVPGNSMFLFEKKLYMVSLVFCQENIDQNTIFFWVLIWSPHGDVSKLVKTGLDSWHAKVVRRQSPRIEKALEFWYILTNLSDV